GGGGGAGNSGGTRPGPEGWPERCGSSHGVTRLAALAGIAGTITASSAKARRVLIALLSAPALLLTSALNLSRSFVVSARPPDLSDRAKHLFIAAMGCGWTLVGAEMKSGPAITGPPSFCGRRSG